MEQQPHHVCEGAKLKQKQNQVKSRSNQPRALLLDLSHKQTMVSLNDSFIL